MNHLTPSSSVINIPDDDPLVVVSSHRCDIQKGAAEGTGDWFDIQATVNLSQGDGAISIAFNVEGDPAMARTLAEVEDSISAFDAFLASLHAARNRFANNVRQVEETFGIA